MLEKKKTDMKSAFDSIISGQDMADERISRLEDILIKISNT